MIRGEGTPVGKWCCAERSYRLRPRAGMTTGLKMIRIRTLKIGEVRIR